MIRRCMKWCADVLPVALFFSTLALAIFFYTITVLDLIFNH